jgi:protoporphyrinogen oxidase
MSTIRLCPLLELDRSLSPYYWLNVGDRDMPFGGVIEQTNVLPPSTYGGRHVVDISSYVDKIPRAESLP